MARINWTRDELLLACALVVENGWRELRPADKRVQNLSKILRKLPLHEGAAADPKFRSPGSVSRKTGDIVTARAGYHGVTTKGGQLTREVVAHFTERTDEMLASAQALHVGVTSPKTVRIPAQEDELSWAREGQLLRRWALYRERNKPLRDRKIQTALEEGSLRCEVCSFDFTAAYGELGDGYIEVHHRLPLHISGVTETQIADLALLCANCHRMCHRSFRGESWRTPAALQRQIQRSV
ncbi:HNH endonuclease [Streptomyces sp. AMCC400023]|uniref:HNH endonuclease n=1 Tax=Streptomyces sp. AMCC400023 TaxID=2056258 RepID=UPI001EFFF6E0|nr:HNH endonuclease [Streptomyces sp. AMCC400023]UJV43210.1 HNH endonuclease [Streptomyces sp. AMCC400023]